MLNPVPLISRQSGALKGAFTPPGDKSISHRAIMLGGIAEGVTTIQGLLEGEDVLCTVAALRAMGAVISQGQDNLWTIRGVGLRGLRAPQRELDMGNSGTAARLLIGLLSGRPFTTTFTGDASLSKRPMERVITPLLETGAVFVSNGGRLPLAVTGAAAPQAITYTLPVASAQVKSAILLAGLSAAGVTTVIEKTPTRDHSETMLRNFGANVTVTKRSDGSEVISITGQPELKGQDIVVPGDPSSAAFPAVAALIRPGSKITLKNVGLNPRRAGLFQTLVEMGAKIAFSNPDVDLGASVPTLDAFLKKFAISYGEGAREPVGDLVVEYSDLQGVTVPADRAPSMIDEFPILAVAAACAKGTTRMCGLSELRVKESDRLALMAEGLQRCGVKVEIEGDDLIVHGNGAPPVAATGENSADGVTISTAMDHRIAMSFLVLGSTTTNPIRIDDGSFIATSFPDFVGHMNGLGMRIE